MFHSLRAFGVISQRRNGQVSARTSCPVVGFWKPGFIDRTEGPQWERMEESIWRGGSCHRQTRWRSDSLRWGSIGLGRRAALCGARALCGDWAVWQVDCVLSSLESVLRLSECQLLWEGTSVFPGAKRLPLGERRRESPSFESDALGVGRNSQYH